MKARLSLTISIAATMLWSCQFDDVLSTPSNDGVIRVTSSLTKTESASGTSTGIPTTSDNFKNNEIIYVWARKTDGGSTDDYIKAWKLTANDDKGHFNGDSKAWPYDGKDLDFHALHGNFDVNDLNDKKWSDLTSLKHTVHQDQSTDENRRQSDLLYAAKTEAKHGNNVELSFEHLLAKITVKLDLSGCQGIESADLNKATISITNIFPDAVLSCSTGTAANGSGNKTTIIAGKITTVLSGVTEIGSAIVPLQSFGNNENIIQITLYDGRIFSYTPEATNLEKSKEYTYTLKIINGVLSVSSITVTDFDEIPVVKSWDIYLGELSVSDITVNGLAPTTADKSWDIYKESSE